MTTLENEPKGAGNMLTGKHYLEDLKLHLDVSSKLDDNGRKALPRRKKIFRIAENIIKELNELEEEAELNSMSEEALKLTSLYYHYGVDSVEDLAMIMAQQWEADKAKQEFKSLVKGNKNSKAIIAFDDVKASGGISAYLKEKSTI